MPWKEKTPMSERLEFLVDWQRGLFSVSWLAERYSVSRKTLHKWIRRYRQEGIEALRERTSRPQESPWKTDAHAEERILALRRKHPDWGPKKLLDVLEKSEPTRLWPAASTVGAILKRSGVVKARRRRRGPGHPGAPVTQASFPNELWAADFKGQFRTRDGVYCYPLTISDLCSRYVLECQGLLNTRCEGVLRRYERVFREYGLPLAIRTDNGAPFASNGLGRLTELSVWLLKLGVRPELTEPASPQQNGCHERMHRTLKACTTRPPSAHLRAQQRRFDEFRREFNEDRPHESLGMKRPAELYRPSPRAFPDKLPPVEYPGHYEVRRVSANGGVRWKRGWLNVSHPLIGEHVGFEEVDDGIWDAYFASMFLGRLDEREGKLYGAFYLHRRGSRGNREGHSPEATDSKRFPLLPPRDYES